MMSANENHIALALMGRESIGDLGRSHSVAGRQAGGPKRGQAVNPEAGWVATGAHGPPTLPPLSTNSLYN